MTAVEKQKKERKKTIIITIVLAIITIALLCISWKLILAIILAPAIFLAAANY